MIDMPKMVEGEVVSGVAGEPTLINDIPELMFEVKITAILNEGNGKDRRYTCQGMTDSQDMAALFAQKLTRMAVIALHTTDIEQREDGMYFDGVRFE